MKNIPLVLNGRRVRQVCRHLLALGLVLTVFLPTLFITVSAHVPAETPSDNEHWIIYRGANGDTDDGHRGAGHERSSEKKSIPENLAVTCRPC